MHCDLVLRTRRLQEGASKYGILDGNYYWLNSQDALTVLPVGRSSRKRTEDTSVDDLWSYVFVGPAHPGISLLPVVTLNTAMGHGTMRCLVALP